MKHYGTKIEIADYLAHRENDNSSVHDELRDGPSRQLLHRYITRYQVTHQDYYPIDVGSIRWLIGQSTTSQFLSLEQMEPNTSRPSFLFFKNTIKSLETLRLSIYYGQSQFGDRELQEVPLFIQMEWMRNFKTPPQIMHCWTMISRFLQTIQDIVPQANPEWMEQWFSVVHSFWDFVLMDVRNHLFFRTFRSIDEIPRFQHSVRWTMFFFMFQTAEDTPEMVRLKEIILSNAVFRKGIRDFIETVEVALDEIKPVQFSRVNMSDDDTLTGTQMDAEVTLIFEALNRNEWYQRWLAELLIDSCDRWRSAMVDALERGLDDCPRKEVLAASMLWDVETIIAYIEPTVFEKEHVHQVLLALRNKVRRHVFALILNESWI